MNVEKLFVWAVGFLAGFAAAMIATDGNGWGGGGASPQAPTPPLSFAVPDTVPKEWSKSAER